MDPHKLMRSIEDLTHEDAKIIINAMKERTAQPFCPAASGYPERRERDNSYLTLKTGGRRDQVRPDSHPFLGQHERAVRGA
jgi:hypothetical protein